MKQFILSSEPDINGKVRLEGGDYRYLARVRRLAPGEYFPAVLPSGDGVMVRVCSVDNKMIEGEVSRAAEYQESVAALPPLILFQALPKADKMDLIVRQAAEGALTEIVPFVSEFSIGTCGAQKFSRWERVIKEARQQSGSATATTLRQPVSMNGLFAYWKQLTDQYPGILGLLFHHMLLVHSSLHGYLGAVPEAVVLAIGPEGGFSPAEVERFLNSGFKPFTVAGSVLRTETAAVYMAAAVRLLLLEKDSWKKNE